MNASIDLERTTAERVKSAAVPRVGTTSGKPQFPRIGDSEAGWPLPPAQLDLADDEIHVWRAALDEAGCDLPSLSETLSAGERDRAERFQFDRDRNRFIARRGLLRMILGRYLSIEPAQCSFTCESRGKPVLAETAAGETLHFNVSHSDGLALFAVARLSAIGVDVEHVRPIPEIDGIAARFFSDREKAMLNALPAEQRREAFFNCWTRKEAYLKATGEGIADALAQIEVSLAPGPTAQLLNVAGDAREASSWSLHPLAPAPGFTGAVAVKARDSKLACWRWPEKFPAARSAR